jgi:hypothetical protein
MLGGSGLRQTRCAYEHGLAPVSPLFRAEDQPPDDDTPPKDYKDGLPGSTSFADLMYTPTASERRERDGSQLPVVLFTCPRCKAGGFIREAVAGGPPGKPYPLCTPCFKAGHRSVMTRTRYASGPLTLHG